MISYVIRVRSYIVRCETKPSRRDIAQYANFRKCACAQSTQFYDFSLRRSFQSVGIRAHGASWARPCSTGVKFFRLTRPLEAVCPLDGYYAGPNCPQRRPGGRQRHATARSALGRSVTSRSPSFVRASISEMSRLITARPRQSSSFKQRHRLPESPSARTRLDRGSGELGCWLRGAGDRARDTFGRGPGEQFLIELVGDGWGAAEEEPAAAGGVGDDRPAVVGR